MHHGPCPTTRSLDELSRIRLDYLRGHPNKASANEPHEFSERDATLESYQDFEEVVLWFEHDLLDQLQLLQILAWFEGKPINTLNLSLICIDRFEGVPNFRGIGQLSSEQMASLYPQRQRVSQTQLSLAKTCWQSFCHSDPTGLVKAVQKMPDKATSSNDDLLFVRPALGRYFQEFPWTSDGLTRTERQLLQIIDSGIRNPVKAFVDNMDFESHLYIGDWRTYSQLAQLCKSDTPLIACADGSAFFHPPFAEQSIEEFKQQELVVTEFGKAIIAGEKSALGIALRDEWLGGVHNRSQETMWCWDNDKGRLIQSTGL